MEKGEGGRGGGGETKFNKNVLIFSTHLTPAPDDAFQEIIIIVQFDVTRCRTVFVIKENWLRYVKKR